MALTQAEKYDRVAAILTASTVPKIQALASRIIDNYKPANVCAEPCGINFSGRNDFTSEERADVLMYLVEAEQPTDECFISDSVCRALEFMIVPERTLEYVLNLVTGDVKYKGAWKAAGRMTKAEDRFRAAILSKLDLSGDVPGDIDLAVGILLSVRDSTKFREYLDHPNARVKAAAERAGSKLAAYMMTVMPTEAARHKKVASDV